MTFDWTVNIGHIITIVSVFGAFLLAYIKVVTDIKVLQMQQAATKAAVDALDKKVEAFGNVLIALGEQKTQIEMLWKLVDELRHGEGFVFNLPQYKGPGKPG